MTVWNAILPLVGVLLGAILSPLVAFLFARAREREERKRDAYIAFVRSIANIANRPDQFDGKSELIDALRRANLEMMIYGSPTVIAAVKEIMRIKDFSRPEAAPAFTQVLVEMRRDVGAKKFATEASEIRSVMFGEER